MQDFSFFHRRAFLENLHGNLGKREVCRILEIYRARLCFLDFVHEDPRIALVDL